MIKIKIINATTFAYAKSCIKYFIRNAITNIKNYLKKINSVCFNVNPTQHQISEFLNLEKFFWSTFTIYLNYRTVTIVVQW